MSSQSIGQKLVAGLTIAQTACLLDAVFELWDASKADELLVLIDEDTAAVLSRVLNPDTESSAEQVVSDEKYAEQWQQLWREWEAVAMEVGDEEGEYVEQEADWEPPYFDGFAVAAALEKIAEKMLPMLGKVHALDIEEEDIFSGALQELEANIDGYPEWMGAENSEFPLESTTTRCVLQWEWLVASETANSAVTFTDNIRDIQETLEILDWDNIPSLGVSYDFQELEFGTLFKFSTAR